jgi:excisionase family DNA binding protein
MQQSFHDRYIDINEAALYLSAKKSWLYQNHKTKGIPSYNIGRKLVFKTNELDHWMQHGSL